MYLPLDEAIHTMSRNKRPNFFCNSLTNETQFRNFGTNHPDDLQYSENRIFSNIITSLRTYDVGLTVTSFIRNDVITYTGSRKHVLSNKFRK